MRRAWDAHETRVRRVYRFGRRSRARATEATRGSRSVGLIFDSVCLRFRAGAARGVRHGGRGWKERYGEETKARRGG